MFTFEEQIVELSTPIAQRWVHRSDGVKGDYASGDYVTWMLNHIFTPAGWSQTILSGPELIELSDKTAYVKTTVRLTVTFENGATVIKDEVGVWPLTATKAGEGGTLEKTAPDRFETVLKAAVTDGLKACAERLGVCFRPLSDKALCEAIQIQIDKVAEKERKAQPAMSAKDAIEELYGKENAGDEWLAQNGLQRISFAGIEPGDWISFYRAVFAQFGYKSINAAMEAVAKSTIKTAKPKDASFDEVYQILVALQSTQE